MSAVTNGFAFFFMNGIMNEDKDGSTTTDVIQSIIKEEPIFKVGKAFVVFHYNDAAPTERVIQEVALGIGGAIATGYSIDKEVKKKGDAVSRSIGFAGACAIFGAVYDYKNMQEDKNRIASSLAGRVSKFLEEDKSNIANLILHSQGADVGYRTLEILEKYKDRIRVVTLGAMTTIPNGMCDRVVNYKFTNDWVSRVVAIPFEIVRQSMDDRERVITDLSREELTNHHDVHEYLKEPVVRTYIRNLLS
ncbi:MAG: hypothetical protein AB7H48_07885 [Parachlamydiales bacterium]